MHRCPDCSAALPLRRLRCGGCGRELVPAGSAPAAEALADELARELRGTPYARSAKELGYVLRSQVRGFLDDPRHPLPRRLRHFLDELTRLGGGDEGGDRLLAHCTHTRLRAAHPWLEDALELVRERHRRGPGQSM